MAQWDKYTNGSQPNGFLGHPAEIEARSMEIIAEELNSMGIVLPEENAPVIRRVIHASADFSYAQNLYFSDQAVSMGIDAFRRGIPVVTDTNMAKSGISQKGLARLSSHAECFMADPDVARAARTGGTTRAVCAMQKAAGLYPSAIFAVGNAPTALFALISLMDNGLRPSLVIGVPVGFVNVVEAKEALVSCCTRHQIPVIAAMGRKGGSTIAAAICNALIYLAAGMEDPHAR